MTSKRSPSYPLAELHAHLGTSISPAVLWQIAHNQGIKLPKGDYQDFKDHIRLSLSHRVPLNEYFETIYHPILDRISSGTHAVENATYNTFAGAFRSGISLMELRNNPMKHNGNAFFDLDHIIMAMLRGMERALLEHKQLSAGLIFIMAREFSYKKNLTIVEKAIKYHHRGVVGIDVAGPAHPAFKMKDYADVFKTARKAGLKITVHTGEVLAANDIGEALEYAKPDRIGHGIRAAYDKSIMKELVKRKVVLEVCPLSNVVTEAVENMEEMKFILRTFIENKVKFCINTDWPETIEGNHLRQQFAMLIKEELLSEEELAECNRTAFKASFIPRPGLDAYL